MKPAWRGIVLESAVWAWPTILWDHNEAFAKLPWLNENTCRWRQWNPGEPVDFDPGASQEDKQLVKDWLARSDSMSETKNDTQEHRRF